MTNLSETARKALINAAGRQGAPVVAGTVAAFLELVDAGLVTEKNAGLTRKGTIAREKAVRAAEDAAFGA